MDLDGDGVADLISGSWPGELFFFKGHGHGNFDAPIKLKDNSGHTINIEEPDAFNRAVLEFLLRVDEGRAARRDPRSAASGILGFKK